MQDQTLSRLAAAALAALIVCTISGLAVRAQGSAAFFVRSLTNPAERRESRPDILDTPVLSGSVMKMVTLVAALESQAIEPDTTRICRRTVTVNGKRYTCSHPDLKRALTAAEALAHSCNDFFVSLAPSLSREMFNRVRAQLGLPPIGAGADLAASFVGLDGPRLTPRTLLDIVARLAGVDPHRPLALAADTRRVLLSGLRGAADYGSASALGARKITALAKTGTAPMPGGGWMGMVVALEPAVNPTRGLVVVAPGAAGLDAAAIAADLLTAPGTAKGASNSAAPAHAKPPPSRHSIRISVNGRVTTFDLEDYVARVVSGEGQPRASDAAQQALAITARTYAVANLNRHRREGYDVCDTTHCQVLRAATDTTRRAAEATAGRVLVYRGQPASVYYSALCGGHSELASNVWPGAEDYASHLQRDDACRDEPAWSSDVRADQIERALRAAGHRGERLRELRIVQRNASGRVSRVRVVGFTPNEISGHDFRMAIARVAGWEHMKSTAFDVRRLGSGYRFTGTGFGHGVGLCVIGAGHRAARGSTADDILKFYFPSLGVEPYRPGAPAPPARTTAPAAAPANARADVLVALPAPEEGERAHIVQLVRAARDAMAARTGTQPPAAIRVTVHPTVDAFARATGQPWWVSGASEGANIDLLPLSILRQQGRLERTVRHEVAHVLVDGALEGRPLWVREGAALYFADPAGTIDPPGRAGCPGDEEFLRPLSAGTHRSAYARAEACFRHAIAQGKRWTDIR
ncbi:MAG TPA: SpoIID/LytB domain-containing protein [Vicinamibacterales bacterium]|nr:SpoIID/LytB domain-containing protein [Vicinamibacterales bacterium]